MRRRDFMVVLAGVAANWPLLWPFAARAQKVAAATEDAASDQIGQVGTLQGIATATRVNVATPIALKVNDPVFKRDTLQTGADSALGVTFDDETTFSLSANSRIVIDEFVYEEGAKNNAATVTVARGTAAFVASLVAKSGDMKISTSTATMGIRGTTGVVEVPEGGAPGGNAAAAGEPKIKLYADADGHVGQIQVFNRQGNQLGVLTQSASAFSLRPGVGGRLEAVPYQIPPQEAARDRGVLQRLFAAHNIGRRRAHERLRSRARNRHRQQEHRNGRRPGRPGRRPQR